MRKVKHFSILCCLVYFVSYITRINYQASISAIITDLGITKDLASIAVTGSFITYGLGQIIICSICIKKWKKFCNSEDF